MRAWAMTVVSLVMLFKAVLAPLLVAAASATASPGTILVPICGGGVIQYVEIDLSAGDSEPQEQSPTETVVAEMDCPVLGAFVVPSGPDARTAAAAPICAELVHGPCVALHDAPQHLRPPSRGPPSVS